MCGICGYFGINDPHLIKRMLKTIQHRGPDDTGHYSHKNVVLGNCRLAIIDQSSAGHQPMSNEDGSVWITYNGEIYNFMSLRRELTEFGHSFRSRTDTEILLHGYEEWGDSLLKKLDGMFAFAIYDRKTHKLVLARDRLGIKPLYYSVINGKLLFASEIKAILQYDFDRKINNRALNEFVTFRYNINNETLIKNIFKLSPGTYGIWDGRRFQQQSYWDYPYEQNKIPFDEAKNELSTVIPDSLKHRLVSDTPVGLFLSSGIDSNILLSSMCGHTTKKVNTFSVGYDSPEFTGEQDRAGIVGKYFNMEHRGLLVDSAMLRELPNIIWHCDELNADPAMVPTYFLSQSAARHVKVILTGDGADELFAGYERLSLLYYANRHYRLLGFSRAAVSLLLRALPSGIINKLASQQAKMGTEEIKRLVSFMNSAELPGKAYLELSAVFTEEEKEHLFSEKISSEMEPYSAEKNVEQILGDTDNGQTFLQRLLHYETKMRLPNDLLLKLDAMTMAHSLEGRVPYLSHRLVEFALSLPDEYKIRMFSMKHILRQTSSLVLPREMSRRPKKHFYVPVLPWLQNELHPLMLKYFSEEYILEQQIFNYAYIHGLQKDLAHAGIIKTRQLWNILVFQIWYDIYIKNNRAEEQV